MANARLSGARRVEASVRSAAPVTRTAPKSAVRSYENLDRLLHATQGRLTHGISPVALWSARTDWLVHLLNAPGKQLSLLQQAWQDGTRLALWAQRRTLGLEAAPPAAPQPGGQGWKLFDTPAASAPSNGLCRLSRLKERGGRPHGEARLGPGARLPRIDREDRECA